MWYLWSISRSQLVILGILHFSLTPCGWEIAEFQQSNITCKCMLCSTNTILTVNMLNCFKYFETYVNIYLKMYSHFVSYLGYCSTEETPMVQPYMLPILYCHYHACWCSGDLSRQGINMYGIDQMSRNIPSLVWEELRSQFTLEVHQPRAVYFLYKWSNNVGKAWIKQLYSPTNDVYGNKICQNNFP